MALEISRQTIEIETGVGGGISQTLARAETLVPGAGREPIEVLLADAMVAIESVEAQTDRVVAEGAVHCQASYRQGDETTLRAVAAQTRISQVFDMPGAAPGMTARACAAVEHVEARYENGHMVFLVTVTLTAQAMKLTPVELVTKLDGAANDQTLTDEICSCRILAETNAAASLREETTLPAALDARTALMEWGEVWVESCQADLGGVRVKGRVNVETLISSGLEGRPAASVRSNLDFDQLAEVPEWLAGDVCAEAQLTRLTTRVEQGGEKEDSLLVIEADIAIKVSSLGRDCVTAVTDAYAVSGRQLEITGDDYTLCRDIRCVSCTDQVKGTLLLSENAPGVGSVIGVVVHPNISGWSTNSDSAIEGILEATVLYMPGGSDIVASARSEMPFSVKCPGELNDSSMVCLRVLSAEASTLMSDRVELKANIGVTAFTRDEKELYLVNDISEGEPLIKKPGLMIVWPTEDDTPWTIGKRYSVPEEYVASLRSQTESPGKAIVIKM